ncbi:F-box/kelch-repeat protein At3g23880-like [Lycium barbarum]|uniref:F-box/kelch-repeat protein At3g23880-like n=1 Tax=Lycium barbarum TaxID=112863 RepID=UPI00293E577E|nr:F-box/kelch-repeat protein At3g23880-like [Lycium barbarum]
MATKLVEFNPKRSKPAIPTQFPSSSIPILPGELITEILSRLPVKSLLKFRSASKSWLALISSPEFIKNHLSISANNKEYTHHRLILSFPGPRSIYNNLKDCSLGSLLDGSVVEVSELNRPPGTFWFVMGSVNGLVCLVSGLCISFVNEKKKVVLWNPSIRKYKKLPDLGTSLSKATCVLFGFGYDEFHDDYKVVGFYYSFGNLSSVEGKIYSLKEDSWRSTHYPLPDELRFYGKGMFVNGKLHWTYRGRKIIHIISIDLADEKWEKVEPPCWGEEDVLILDLVVLGNNLSVIRHGYPRNVNPDTDVWVMKEYGVKESWTKMFTLKYPVSSPPFLISNKDEILLMFGKKFLLYNLKDESVCPGFGNQLNLCVSIGYVLESQCLLQTVDENAY